MGIVLYNGAMKRKALLLVATLSFFILSGAGSAYAQVRFSSEATLYPISIILPVIRNARENPPKPLEIMRWSFSDGQKTWTEERARVSELWMESQHAASWLDLDGGNVQILARMTKIPPQGIGEQATREAFEAKISSPVYDIDADADESELAEWMAAFCGNRVDGMPQTLAVNRSRLAKVLQFNMSDPTLRAYAFRLNTGYPGQGKAPRNWFAIVLKFSKEPGSELDKTIESDLLGKIKTTSSFDGTRAVSVRKNRTRNTTRQVHEGPVRDRARKSIELMSTWWYMDTENYIMLSNHDTAEKFAGEILDEMEMMRPHYEVVAPKFPTADDDIGVIRLFSDDVGYLSYLKDDFVMMDPGATGGIFSGSRRELVIRPVSGNMRATREGSIRGIIKHEGFHQYVFMAMDGILPSAWFNEGFASFFENSELDRRGAITVMESAYHADILTDLIKRGGYNWEEVLSSHLSIDYAQFYAEAKHNYAVSWGLAYYLVRGAPDERGKPYANIIPTYLDALSKTGKADLATAAAFADIDMKKFSDDFTSFWTTVKKRQDAKQRKGL